MLLLNPAFILFFVSIIVSIFIVASSPSLFFVWLGLELNTLCFIPLLLNTKNSSSSEASIKYFLTQTLASVVFIFSCVLMLSIDNNYLSISLICCSLFIKLGVAPFHGWFPSVSSLLSWDVFFLLLTIQKINPLLVVTLYFSPFNVLNTSVMILTLFLGSMMGVIQVSTRLLLTYSSINQVGWFLITSYTFPSFLFWFFGLYMILLLCVVVVLRLVNIQHINQFSSLPSNSLIHLFLMISLLSMGGMPPFLGFFGKWMVLTSVLGANFYFLSLTMIFTSLFVLFFYLRMSTSSFLLKSNKWNYFNLNQYPLMLMLLLSVSFLGLPLSIFI